MAKMPDSIYVHQIFVTTLKLKTFRTPESDIQSLSPTPFFRNKSDISDVISLNCKGFSCESIALIRFCLEFLMPDVILLEVAKLINRSQK